MPWITSHLYVGVNTLEMVSEAQITDAVISGWYLWLVDIFGGQRYQPVKRCWFQLWNTQVRTDGVKVGWLNGVTEHLLTSRSLWKFLYTFKTHNSKFKATVAHLNNTVTFGKDGVFGLVYFPNPFIGRNHARQRFDMSTAQHIWKLLSTNQYKGNHINKSCGVNKSVWNKR